MELDSNIYQKIKDYSAEGEKLFFDGRFHEALREYNKAFDVIPEPKQRWEAYSAAPETIRGTRTARTRS